MLKHYGLVAAQEQWKRGKKEKEKEREIEEKYGERQAKQPSANSCSLTFYISYSVFREEV